MPGTESLAASRLARALFRDAPWRIRMQQRYRPYVCSFDPLLPEIRAGGGRLLDFGCGAGLLAFHCVAQGYVAAADGVDVDAAVIDFALRTATTHPFDRPIAFHAGRIPDGRYDAMTMVDVMHHIPPDQQRATFADLAGRLEAGGVFVYKDIGRRPRWRAIANQLHDLALNRQWARLVPIETVIDWAVSDHGLGLVRRATFNQLVYGHELAVFRRPAVNPPPL